MYCQRRWRTSDRLCDLFSRRRNGEYFLSPSRVFLLTIYLTQYIGNEAKQHLVKNSANTIVGFRNLLGKK